ncbi:hypothetical protein EXE48_11675 [Halorubrum sp. ASP1]|uniref:hypothetical protein n=1 Tax=Halorubrum sp. ASP1 TaxID=2518114 RepID=UPI0010F9A155|nr:hypothetical protein [Halorubrum sp. ASP1]TKX60624.1 hypothetical protein EXE48_11675 [Halorubrum sp. ASP1]
MADRTLTDFTTAGDENTDHPSPGQPSQGTDGGTPADSEVIEHWNERFAGGITKGTRAGVIPNREVDSDTSSPIALDPSEEGLAPITSHPSTEKSVVWDPVLKPFNGAQILTPHPAVGTVGLPSTKGIEASEVAYVHDGLEEYLDSVEYERVSFPKYYSRFGEEFTPYIGAWTATASDGAVGINPSRLEQMIRLVNGSGGLDHRKTTVYGCGPNPAVVSKGSNAFLVSPVNVTPTDSQHPPKSALQTVPTNGHQIELPEELTVGSRGLSRIISAFDRAGLVLSDHLSTANGQVSFAVDAESAGAAETDDPTISTSISDPRGDADQPEVILNTDDLRTAATGFGSVEGLMDDLRARPTIDERHLEAIPEPTVLPGESLSGSLAPDDSTFWPTVISIDYAQPNTNAAGTDLTRHKYGCFRYTVLTEYTGYKSKTHRVKIYTQPVTVQHQREHDEVTREYNNLNTSTDQVLTGSSPDN